MSASSSRLGGNRGRLTEKRTSAEMSPSTRIPILDILNRTRHKAPGGCSWPAGSIGLSAAMPGRMGPYRKSRFIPRSCWPLADRLDESCAMEPLMEAPRLECKLVAILAADVEGYSRHMEQDEVATLATLSLCLLFTPSALSALTFGRSDR
jgi:hypothetical protein